MSGLDFVIDQALILIPVLYIVGIFLKASSVKDNLIPITLLVLGVGLSMLKLGFNVDALLQGVLTAGAAVFADQLVKQARK